jgi:hypothetical protein
MALAVRPGPTGPGKFGMTALPPDRRITQKTITVLP